MDTNALKKFAQDARRQLIDQVRSRIEHVLRADSVELRDQGDIVAELKSQIALDGLEKVIEDVAYIWFNRLCALRYMDVNHYTPVGTVSPQPGFTLPELLQEAKSGIFDDDFPIDRRRALGLLTGITPSNNPEQTVYRELLMAVCKHYSQQMGFLFEAIEDYTALLIPEDLLSSESILQAIREALTAENCQDVEVIGWLYQFYISERKDKVMGAKGAVAKADIPAVTQLFTPDWIVRYMVQNSLGRLWLLNHPDSNIRQQMEYTIEPTSPEDSFLRIQSPQEIRFLDPACGSGHILTYAFDLLVVMYEEQGYDPTTIPTLILEHNLYGIEIDERAAQLAGFALMMKAMQVDREFLTRDCPPNICLMGDVAFSSEEIYQYMDKLGRDLWPQELWQGLKQFENAETFGALIRPVIQDVPELRRRMEARGIFNDLFLSGTNEKVEQVLAMAEVLSPRYQVVVANPPYMGGNKFNGDFKRFTKDQYPETKSDAFAMFIERGFELIPQNGYNAMVTMQSWMFLSSYEKMRETLLKTVTIKTMVHMANMVMGIAFGTAATVWQKKFSLEAKGQFSYVNYEDLTENKQPHEFPVKNERLTTTSTADFKKIPGAPIAYWVSDRVREVFEEGTPIGELAAPRQGLATSDNNRFLKQWYEVEIKNISFHSHNHLVAKESGKKWFPYNKGGKYRKWYGNNEFLVNWFNDGEELMGFARKLYGSPTRTIKNIKHYFKPSIIWSALSSGAISLRINPAGFIFDTKGQCIFPESPDL